ncbi:MAG: hypothetical protein IKP89_10725 [Bacteroidales bacterium]|nr:hypothetical protein [Bacteroidales bacterium]
MTTLPMITPDLKKDFIFKHIIKRMAKTFRISSESTVPDSMPSALLASMISGCEAYANRKIR